MKKNIIYIAIILILLFFVVKKYDKPSVVKTEIEYVTVVDTIEVVKIDSIPTPVYIQKVKIEKGKDSIIYKTKPDTTTIEANQYNTELKSNNATAKLKITTTGELLDVDGLIEFTQENTTITKVIPESGLFLYTETSVNPMLERVELGLDCVIDNKIIIGTSASYNAIAKKPYFNVKIGFKL